MPVSEPKDRLIEFDRRLKSLGAYMGGADGTIAYMEETEYMDSLIEVKIKTIYLKKVVT